MRKDAVQKYYPLKVKMTISNQPYEFLMQPGHGSRQIRIQSVKRTGEWCSPAYEPIVKILDDSATKNEDITEAILKTIKAEVGDHEDYLALLTPHERQAACNLIVLTQLAEGAVPDPKQLEEYFTNVHAVNSNPNDIHGRLAGIDKAARAHLSRIVKNPEHVTFKKIFNKVLFSFFLVNSNQFGYETCWYYLVSTKL